MQHNPMPQHSSPALSAQDVNAADNQPSRSMHSGGLVVAGVTLGLALAAGGAALSSGDTASVSGSALTRPTPVTSPPAQPATVVDLATAPAPGVASNGAVPAVTAAAKAPARRAADSSSGLPGVAGVAQSARDYASKAGSAAQSVFDAATRGLGVPAGQDSAQTGATGGGVGGKSRPSAPSPQVDGSGPGFGRGGREGAHGGSEGGRDLPPVTAVDKPVDRVPAPPAVITPVVVTAPAPVFQPPVEVVVPKAEEPGQETTREDKPGREPNPCELTVPGLVQAHERGRTERGRGHAMPGGAEERPGKAGERPGKGKEASGTDVPGDGDDAPGAGTNKPGVEVDKPSNPDAGKPSDPDAGKPSDPDAGKPSNPDAGKPSNPDAGKPSNPDAGKPGRDEQDNAGSLTRFSGHRPEAMMSPREESFDAPSSPAGVPPARR